MKNLKEVVNNSLKKAQLIYEEIGEFAPLVIVNFEWVTYENKKLDNIELGIILDNEEMVDNRNAIVARLGFIAALMKILGMSSGPDYILFASEAWMSENVSIRPSMDPKRREILVASAMDKKNNFDVDIKEVASVYVEDQMGRAGIKKKLMDNSKINSKEKPVDMSSPLLKSFWDTYYGAFKQLENDKVGGVPVYKKFLELGEKGRRTTFDTIFKASLGELYKDGIVVLGKKNEKIY